MSYPLFQGPAGLSGQPGPAISSYSYYGTTSFGLGPRAPAASTPFGPSPSYPPMPASTPFAGGLPASAAASAAYLPVPAWPVGGVALAVFNGPIGYSGPPMGQLPASRGGWKG